jgi:GNAT superfamily N-acetyltransferase
MSVSDNSEKWRFKTEDFKPAQFQKTKKVREFTLHWRPVPRDRGYFDIVATISPKPGVYQVVGTVFYGPWNTEDSTRLEGAIEVDPNFRRKGLASAMYDWGEQLSGLKFAPASSHTDAAEAFWQARKRHMAAAVMLRFTRRMV